MSGADLIDFETLEASGEDGNEGDLDEGDEVLLGPVDGRSRATAGRGSTDTRLSGSPCAAPVSAGFGPDRVGLVPSAAMAASSASTASTKASTSAKASQEAGDVLAGLTAVPICCWLGDC
jgi:hypothetical protein